MTENKVFLTTLQRISKSFFSEACDFDYQIEIQHEFESGPAILEFPGQRGSDRCVSSNCPGYPYTIDEPAKTVFIRTCVQGMALPMGLPEVLGRLKPISVSLNMMFSSLAIHSSCLRLGSGCLLFCGPSGSGKSTLADLFSSEFDFVCDDLCFAQVSRTGIEVYSTPFSKPFRVQKCSFSKMKLKGLFILTKSESNFILRCDDRARFQRLVTNVFFPRGSRQDEAVFDIIEALLENAPIFEIHFSNHDSAIAQLAPILKSIILQGEN